MPSEPGCTGVLEEVRLEEPSPAATSFSRARAESGARRRPLAGDPVDHQQAFRRQPESAGEVPCRLALRSTSTLARSISRARCVGRRQASLVLQGTVRERIRTRSSSCKDVVSCPQQDVEAHDDDGSAAGDRRERGRDAQRSDVRHDFRMLRADAVEVAKTEISSDSSAPIRRTTPASRRAAAPPRAAPANGIAAALFCRSTRRRVARRIRLPRPAAHLHAADRPTRRRDDARHEVVRRSGQPGHAARAVERARTSDRTRPTACPNAHASSDA